MVQCRLCGHDRLTEALQLPRSPANISRLLRDDELSKDRAIDLTVFSCDACGFVQLTQFLGDEFYDDYVMTTKHSPQMQAFQAEQARSFVERFGLNGKRVIEVGCGDGNYLGCLQAAGAVAQGIEPSARFRALAEKAGHRVHGGYVGVESRIPGDPYDAFVTRQVFEHVPDPNDFLQGIRASLVPGGAGLVEVPSLEQALEGRRFYDFFADHLNYYSDRTLRFALEKNGFQVIDLSRGMNGEYNVARVVRAQDHDLSDIQCAVTALADDIRGFIDAHLAAGRRVAVWGSGGKGLATMAIADVRGISYVVDSDPHKLGRYTPVSHFQIVAPNTLKSNPVDAVLVTALAYRDEVLAQLRDDIGFRGEIALLGPRLQVLPSEI